MKRAKILCDPYIWENPRVAFYTSIFGPNQDACVSEVVNHIVFTAVVLGIAGTLFTKVSASSIPMVAAIVGFFVLTAPTLRLALLKSKQYEAFQGSGNSIVEEEPPVVVVPSAPTMRSSPYTTPTARNPFMNVLVDEYKYNPKRSIAASVMDPSVQVTLDDFFRTEFVRDPTDVFGRSQSQRQFITMPSTSIPNDQESYQNWLYKLEGKTCKEGGREACLPGTDGGALPWLNQDS